jgi:hypothetical protein
MSDPRFKQKPLNGCSGCRQDFTSTSLFDLHRIGSYGPGEYQGNPADWTPRLGRRCLDEEEMTVKGWTQDDRGRWTDPVRVQASREAFARAA